MYIVLNRHMCYKIITHVSILGQYTFISIFQESNYVFQYSNKVTNANGRQREEIGE